MPRPDREKGVILFVHGFGSSETCWEPLLKLLRQEEQVTREFELVCFNYPTAWFSLNPLRRIPRLKEIGRALENFIDSPRFHRRELTLVGHSQGGLAIQSFIASVIQSGRGERLAPIRQVILMATPNLGSTTASFLRKMASRFVPNPQERSLRVLDPEIGDIRSVIRDQVLSVPAPGTSTTCPIPMHAFVAMEDGVVLEASARGDFENITEVKGDHFSILTPVDQDDIRYAEFLEAILHPAGHHHVFEIERYETEIAVEPVEEREFEVTHGTKRDLVKTDNIGQVSRTVRFARSNRCRLPLTIRYGTKGNGYIHPTMIPPENEATEAEKERYDDYGLEVVYKFRDKGREYYRLDVEVYKGFDAGNRVVHFHLGQDSYYGQLIYKLDLKRYLESGFLVTDGPKLFFHPDDPGHGELCERRRRSATPEPPAASEPGLWRWEFERVRQGVVDIIWDVGR